MEIGFILSFGSRGSVHNGRGSMATGSQSRKLRDHMFNCKQEMNWELGLGQGYKLSKPVPADIRPPARLHLLMSYNLLKPNGY